MGVQVSSGPPIWLHRITAIMPACRAGDRGSTPLEVAKDCLFSLKDPHLKQVVFRVLLIIGIRPVSSSGCRITEVSVAWDHVAKVRLLLLRPNVRVTELA